MSGFDALDEVSNYPGYREDAPGGLSISYLSTYPPRQCGLATYCEDLLTTTLTIPGAGEPMVFAMENRSDHYDYPWPVLGTVDDREESEYEAAAQFVNESPAEIVSIQHEFGIFGGARCRGLYRFLQSVSRPIVTTLHTVLPTPSPPERAMIRDLAGRSDRVVILNGLAEDILQREYQVDRRKIALIYHGAPAPSCEDRETLKERLGLAGRRVLSTFGLVGRGKGLEHAIAAMPAILRAHPDACYVIAGESHPDALKTEKERYREELVRLVAEHGLEESVVFINRYLTKAEIVSYLGATDVYLTPYLNPHQISSGTLAYAVAAGRAVVSTSYLYARFLLRDGRGMLVDFAHSDAIAAAANRVLDDPALQGEMESRSRVYGKRMLWPMVAARHVSLYRDVLREQQAYAPEAAYVPVSAEYDYMTPRGAQ
jgi:glycosyltransferase involved in cell wall biosynthesis